MSTQPQCSTAFLDGSVTKFDLVLAAIPLVLLIGIAAPPLLAVPEFVGIALGATLAAGLVGYSIYAIARIQSTASSSELQLGKQAT